MWFQGELLDTKINNPTDSSSPLASMENLIRETIKENILRGKFKKNFKQETMPETSSMETTTESSKRRAPLSFRIIATTFRPKVFRFATVEPKSSY